MPALKKHRYFQDIKHRFQDLPSQSLRLFLPGSITLEPPAFQPVHQVLRGDVAYRWHLVNRLSNKNATELHERLGGLGQWLSRFLSFLG
jgi:hypothetical protein